MWETLPRSGVGVGGGEALGICLSKCGQILKLMLCGCCRSCFQSVSPNVNDGTGFSALLHLPSVLISDGIKFRAKRTFTWWKHSALAMPQPQVLWKRQPEKQTFISFSLSQSKMLEWPNPFSLRICHFQASPSKKSYHGPTCLYFWKKRPVMLTEMGRNRASFLFKTRYCAFLEAHLVCVLGVVRKRQCRVGEMVA